MVFITANQCVILISASMQRAVCPAWCIGPAYQLLACVIETSGYLLLTIRVVTRQVTERPVELPPFAAEPMPPVAHVSNRLLRSLSAAELDALRPHLEIVELVRETVLLEAGAPFTHVYLHHSGVISMVVRLAEGQAVELAMVGRDSVVGAAAALDGGISLTDAVVRLAGTASILDVANVRAAADRSRMFRTLLARHEQAQFAEVQQSAACNASHSVEARLSRWLLRARDLSDSEHLPLTQEFLAQMIGAQRNAVSIVAHALQLAGIISYSRGHIEITNLEGLRETSCECYDTIKTQHLRLLVSP
jgi:CRP-like cAMP-binding protein